MCLGVTIEGYIGKGEIIDAHTCRIDNRRKEEEEQEITKVDLRVSSLITVLYIIYMRIYVQYQLNGVTRRDIRGAQGKYTERCDSI